MIIIIIFIIIITLIIIICDLLDFLELRWTIWRIVANQTLNSRPYAQWISDNVCSQNSSPA